MVDSYYNEPRRPENKTGWKLLDWQEYPGEGKGPGSDSTESEQARAKLAAEASSPGVRAKAAGDAPPADPIGSIAQFIGEQWNAGVNAAAGIDAQKKFVDNVTPAVAQEFKRGKELTDAGYTAAQKASALTQDDRKALEVYRRINGDMVASIPLYEQNALRRNVEQGILAKALDAQSRPDKANSTPSQPAGERVTAPAQNVAAERNVTTKQLDGPTEKTEPRSRGPQTDARPAWLVQGQENNALFADKPNAHPASQNKVTDAKLEARAPEIKLTAASNTGLVALDSARSSTAGKPLPLDSKVEKTSQAENFSAEARRPTQWQEDLRQPARYQSLQTADTKSQILPEQRVQSEPGPKSKSWERMQSDWRVAESKPEHSKVDEYHFSEREKNALPTADTLTGAKRSAAGQGDQMRCEPDTCLWRLSGVRESDRYLVSKVAAEGKERINASIARHLEKSGEPSAPAAPGRSGTGEQPVGRIEPGPAVRLRTEGETKSGARLQGTGAVASPDKTEHQRLKTTKEAALAIVCQSVVARSSLPMPADAGKLDALLKSPVLIPRIHTETPAIEMLRSAQKESVREKSIPARVVYARVAPTVLSVSGDGRAAKPDRLEKASGVPAREARAIDGASSTKSDTASGRNTVVSNDAGQSKTKAGPAADGARTVSQSAANLIDVTVPGVFTSRPAGGGPQALNVKDTRIMPTQSNFITDKRYITGTEIALAAVIAAAGAARVRAEALPGRPGATVAGNQKQPVQVTPWIGSRITGNEEPDMEAQNPGTTADGHASRNALDMTAGTGVPRTGEVSPCVPSRQAQSIGQQACSGVPDTIEQLLTDWPSLEIVDGNEAVSQRPSRVSKPEDPEGNLVYVGGFESANQDICAPHPVLRRPSTLISAGDTFVSIAEAFFNDANLGWLIADLNRDRARESRVGGKRVVEIRSRQQIELPVWEDIVDFYTRRSLDAIPENIVTIVEENRLDAELLSRLSTVIGLSAAGSNHRPQSIFVRSAQQDSPHWPYKHRGK